jgi:hypothetical protein
MRFAVQLPTSLLQKAVWCASDFYLDGKRGEGDIDISLQSVMSHAFSLAGHGGNVVRRAAAADRMGIQLSGQEICALDQARCGEVSARAQT